MSERGPRRIAVIGAGSVGASAALWLQQEGHAVTLIDSRDPGTGTSFGNAGALVGSSVAPLAMPGILKDLPGMLFDPLGPLVVRWRHLPRLTPFLLRLLAASRPQRVEEISKALAELSSRSVEAWRAITKIAGSEHLVRPVGWLKVYESKAGFDATSAERALFDRRGMRYEILNEDELRQLEPALSPRFKHALHQPDCAFSVNPGRMVASLAEALVAGGGHFLKAEVLGFEMEETPRHVLTSQGPVETEAVVLAAGPWSRQLARALGATVPLESERGYHVMLPSPQRNLTRPTVWGERSFVLAPMEGGVRLTSGVELAATDAPPDYRRVRALLPLAKEMLPDLVAEEKSIWMGRRPSLPDSLPVIGVAPRYPDTYLAFGHGHLGLTQGPITGRLIADLVAGRTPPFNLSPYSPTRWQR